MECLLIASTTLELSQVRQTVPPLHPSCHSIKACKTANSSFQSIFLALWREGIRSEKTMRLCTPPIPFAPLASVATSKMGRDSWIIEIDDHDVRNCSHHRRSLRESRLSRI